MTSNSCVLSCPDGTYGDRTTNLCILCPFYTYNDDCILMCPSKTKATLNPKPICSYCGDNCTQPSYTISVSS